MVAGLIIGSFARAAELPAVACDVVVVGGGSAGICAAIQSARAGAKTMLIEAAHQVGATPPPAG
jgi:succinate dehydrogenase/fumarate reductase flavoprotein subunit